MRARRIQSPKARRLRRSTNMDTPNMNIPCEHSEVNMWTVIAEGRLKPANIKAQAPRFVCECVGHASPSGEDSINAPKGRPRPGLGTRVRARPPRRVKFRDTARRENSLARARLRRSIGLPRPRRRLWGLQEIRCHCTLDISARSSPRMAFSRGLLVGGLIDHGPKHRALSRGSRPTESCERVANNAASGTARI
ncbi:MAG: hypothetical protein JWQ17_4980 [Tardiphaga sp.]|nr:hypothetical protein [Tardiphaga sp.]